MAVRSRFNQSARLEAFFSSRAAGDYGNSWGAQLDRLAVMHGESKPCRRCGGRYRRVVKGEVVAPEKGGCGWIVDEVAWGRRKGKAPPKRRGRMSDITRIAYQELGLDPDDYSPRPDAICPDCNGRGWVQRDGSLPLLESPTAQPTGSSRGGRLPRETNAGEGDLQVRIWLDEVRSIDPTAALVIEVYHEHGCDSVPLWGVTKSGKRLAKMQPADSDLDPRLWLQNERDDQREHPFRNPTRRALMIKAEAEVNGLLRSAAQLWNAAVPMAGNTVVRCLRRACGLKGAA
jgi:hypothetical protein